MADTTQALMALQVYGWGLEPPREIGEGTGGDTHKPQPHPKPGAHLPSRHGRVTQLHPGEMPGQ